LDKPTKYTVTAPPHVKNGDSTVFMMLDVLIALLPAMILAVFTFGLRTLTMTAVSVASCVAFEWLWTCLRRKPVTLGDFSCVITGVLLAFLMPVAAPVWLPVIGAAFAVLVVKQLFGGLGQNLFNPALAGHVFLLLLFPQQMTHFTQPRVSLPVLADTAAAASKTPLMILRDGSAVGIDLWQLVLGQHAGALGETATIALLAGGVYLLWRRVLKWRVSLAFIAVTALAALVFPQGGLDGARYLVVALCSGSLLLGALFMATDTVTSPAVPAAQWGYGIGCGLLTVLIRYRGTYADGVAFAILLMNALVWLLDKQLRPRDTTATAALWQRLRALIPGGRKRTEPVRNTESDTREPDPAAVDAAAQEEAQTPQDLPEASQKEPESDGEATETAQDEAADEPEKEQGGTEL